MSQPTVNPIKSGRHGMDNEYIAEKLLDAAGADGSSQIIPVQGFKCLFEVWGTFDATWNVRGRLHPDAPFQVLATGTAAKIPTELPYPLFEVQLEVASFVSGAVNAVVYGERYR